MDDALLQVLREVAVQLCSLGTEQSTALPTNAPSIVFPARRPGAMPGVGSGVRISEAEARTLFAVGLTRRGIPFAIEVPTMQQYCFKGTKPRSARIDLVYASMKSSSNQLRRLRGVEFKAHNPSAESIRKDVEKLLREGHDGLWFHVLRDVDSGSIGALLTKLRGALEIMVSECAAFRSELAVAIVVVEKRLLLWRTVDVRAGWSDALRLGYGVRRGRVEVNDRNGWCVEAL